MAERSKLISYLLNGVFSPGKKTGSVFQNPFARARGHSRSCSLKKTLAVRSKPEGTVAKVSLKMRQFLSLLRQDLGQI